MQPWAGLLEGVFEGYRAASGQEKRRIQRRAVAECREAARSEVRAMIPASFLGREREALQAALQGVALALESGPGEGTFAEAVRRCVRQETQAWLGGLQAASDEAPADFMCSLSEDERRILESGVRSPAYVALMERAAAMLGAPLYMR